MSDTEEDHYYATGYDVDSDPYVYDNGVLINHFNITNTSELNEIEADLTKLSIDQLIINPPPAIFNTDYHCFLHREIFNDVYPWAGELRVVDICKGSTIFLENEKIRTSLDELFTEMADQNYYRGFDAEKLSAHAGIFLNKLNFIHPFREGNGRTQRLLLTQIAQQAGFSINWASISSDSMRKACIEGGDGQHRPMQRLLQLNLEPLDSSSPTPPVTPKKRFRP